MADEKKDSENEDKECLAKDKKNKRNAEKDTDFLGKFEGLKKSGKQKGKRDKEMCGSIRKRNELIENKLKQNHKITTLFEKWVKN